MAQELFDLAIARADLRDGMLLINERKLPLDFAANDLAAKMTYDSIAKRYDGSVQVGKMDLKYADYRDLPATADLQFSLWANNFQVKALKLTSQQSTLAGQRQANDFQKPQIEGYVQRSFDLAQLGAVIRDPQLRGGTLQLSGSASYSEAAGPASTGRIALRDLDYVDNGLVLRKANVNSNFLLANDRLQLTTHCDAHAGRRSHGRRRHPNVLEPRGDEAGAGGESCPKGKAGRVPRRRGQPRSRKARRGFASAGFR